MPETAIKRAQIYLFTFRKVFLILHLEIKLRGKSNNKSMEGVAGIPFYCLIFIT